MNNIANDCDKYFSVSMMYRTISVGFISFTKNVATAKLKDKNRD